MPEPPAPPVDAPLRRATTATSAPKLAHEWLDVTVARQSPQGPVPLPHARVVVRAWPAGEAQPGEPLARAVTDARGATSFHLPHGRYVLAAASGGEAKAVTLTLAHAGRVSILLERAPRLVTLSVELADPAGHPVAGVVVEAACPGGASGRGHTNEHGHALLALPPGAYEVRAAGASARVELAADQRVRIILAHGAAGTDRLREAAATARPYEPPREGPWN